MAANEDDSVSFLVWSTRATAGAGWSGGTVAHPRSIHLRPAQAKAFAYNTAAAHLRAIQAFYSYAESRKLHIDEAILDGRFETILTLLDGYTIWLQSGRQADNLVARISTAKMDSIPQIDPRTRDQYLRLLKQYLSWCVCRYIPRARQNSTPLANIEVAFADVADVIERRFESYIINVRPDRTRYRSLTDTQLQIVRTLIRPGAAQNPFPELFGAV